ncbi:Histidinol-phosphate aminotransferase [Achromobacter spanius]|uniref:histidinol-phosphate transaminase n=1 Tax=Achromobacter spanius TaxID=217203 RepID=UPI000C2B97C9|nr:histidinol-phosphate transaminase [Achromobacter spanius]AUA57162.1 histidinol-phosphate transaminase [Achromobacter spanius]CAB3704725.1 Histidinol-phosphate aminotransferase [Achromobacter spanius]SPT40895.1 Histidinol-phosphate aminotransferase [Achromobacter denitrificans]VEE55160.1 Histidinol-phosphate aminotransferase [Achromobacter spanius]
MSRFWSPVVGTLSPYVPGEQPKLQNLVKLNTNEHPYGPSPRVLEAIRAASDDTLKLYPDPSSDQLRQAIAAAVGVQASQVFVGNGSDEVLAHAFLALLKHDKPLRFPDITYSFYPVYCGLYGIQYETVPLAADFSINVDDYLPDANGQAGAIIFPNPNAPTGRALSLADVEHIVAANPDAVVVVDEAYVDFGAESAVRLVARYDNLLVVQTLSKSRSLAGLRVGFAVGSPELIDGLERVKNSFNSYPIDRLASAGAVAALEDTEYFEQTRQAVIETRSRMTGGLEALGFEVLPSAANFVFARHPLKDAASLAAALRERSIIVRHFRHARIDQFLRITVGTDEQVNLLLKALAEVLQT